MLVPQIMDGMVKVLNLIPQERVLRCTVEKMVDVPAPQIQEQINEVIKVDKTTEELRGFQGQHDRGLGERAGRCTRGKE